MTSPVIICMKVHRLRSTTRDILFLSSRHAFSRFSENLVMGCHNLHFFPVSLTERSGQLTKFEPRNIRRIGKKAAAKKDLTPEKLVRNHASAVLGFCLTFTRNFHDSEDIMQSVFYEHLIKLGPCFL